MENCGHPARCRRIFFGHSAHRRKIASMLLTACEKFRYFARHRQTSNNCGNSARCRQSVLVIVLATGEIIWLFCPWQVKNCGHSAPPPLGAKACSFCPLQVKNVGILLAACRKLQSSCSPQAKIFGHSARCRQFLAFCSPQVQKLHYSACRRQKIVSLC